MKPLFFKAGVKALALCRQKIQTILIAVHDIDRAGHGAPLFINSGGDHRVYLFFQKFQNLGWAHFCLPP